MGKDLEHLVANFAEAGKMMSKSLKNSLARIYVYHELADGKYYAALYRGPRHPLVGHFIFPVKENIFIKNALAFNIVWNNRHNIRKMIEPKSLMLGL
jgi:hypothetical protein